MDAKSKDHIADFLNQVRAASIDQLRIYAKAPKVTLETSDRDTLPFVQHMTHILVTGADLEITFKTHFMEDGAAELLATKLGSRPKPGQEIDFMKEFSNIVAGKTKTMLERGGFVVAQSLPFSIRGYNEIFYEADRQSDQVEAWRLKAESAEIHCSVSIAIRTSDAHGRLSGVKYVPETEDALGEVELF